MKKKFLLSFVCMLLVMVSVSIGVVGCASFKPDATPDQRYLAALTWYNDNLEQYMVAYEQADPATQAEWDLMIKPYWIKGSVALDAWETARNVGSTAREQAWQDVKRQILVAMIEIGIVEVKGGG